ncbi:helix-turn-helix domain-containing protein [Parapedobacter sp. GCM10030251]|uniref:helix-turn-helix domain-containing protein n=1 Tax=Parapedobacter sp. GCM10030251 TaxID=3273419 RepID=UPI00361C2CA7
MNKGTLTELGLYLAKRSVNRAEVARKTGLSTYRLSQLSINPKSQLRADELYLIALAIGEDPGVMFKHLYREASLHGE